MANYQTCDNIILSDASSWSFKNDQLNIISQFIDPLPTENKLTFTCPTPYSYHISSPSVIFIDCKMRCNFRAINYTYNNQDGSYKSKDKDGIVRTRNYIADVDNQYRLSNMWELKDLKSFPVYPCHVMGMEDVRLFGPNYFLCTRLDATSCHHPKMCFGQYDVNTKQTTSLVVLNYGDMKTEKNWLPCYNNNGICRIIYSFEPLTIYTLNLEDGTLEPFLEKKMSHQNLSTFRGSAVPILYKDGWLMTVHQVYYAQKRKYYHRFVWLDREFNNIKFSKCFYFDKIGVEFNLSIAFDGNNNNNNIIITYSVDDNNPTLSFISCQEIDTILNF
ncbi:MAG TPA: hypothetical protein VLG50_07555 [Candidatus Saccharimonadales bacterium]|nr:hypothetical protein [Candidatus Saccharimonadales bacterium]